ncbi:MAG: diguanylate cyclase [Proteobacteria bacterium]|nr:diguanylate cyclase [Pseudomonadota bacterium]MBU1386275.1 diguanylate cyclase [Pseudomonadota bacterium]MBU1542967.1 diguanylate cyclase [Pseudomonadota bacterium]MBU2431491.1 diguanylate cyclase [Pseudomonadota bacterium]MBU2479990.1 diguanylate cyclase [Pseudomonadota bacterium]
MAPVSVQDEAAAQEQFPTHEVDAVVFYGDPTRIYKARRRSNGMPVMLKTLCSERTVREASALLKHEYEMARRLDVPGVIQVFSLERHNNLPVIELEDFGGNSLNNIASQRRLFLEEILNIAIQICRGLAEIHAANIIHKDINPSNIIYNADTGVAKIIDFGISTRLTREQAALTSTQGFEGSLPYISPEQTGRMNRSIDYRTDFYSLGVTLYELVAGRPLFIVNEPIEWFHCHIARQPDSLTQINPDIPGPVCDIIMKLLAKTAEDRYQSAQGIQADLQQCLDQLNATGTIALFTIAQQDISDRFQIPQRLYGRDKEIKQLLTNFETVSCGKCKMVLISGYSGIGKTCLIREIYKPVTERRGHFVSGKFDQLHRNIPYSALAAALRDLVRQLLTAPESELARWRAKILDAVGINDQLIIDMIRELGLIIGEQPAVPKLSPLEAEQRFHHVFLEFIQVFCDSRHPLVIFLDDLQWADSASMRLLDLLTRDESGTTHLLLIGAYRDNEVQAGHPVAVWLKELRQRDLELEEIRLVPLDFNHLSDLLCDTLDSDPKSVELLAQILEQKTAGNPFFAEEFLKALHQADLINYSRTEDKWTWDIISIIDKGMTDNVVELMTAKLQRLRPESLELLKLAACIGFRFPLKALAIVSELPPAQVAQYLQEGMTEGLIAPIGEAYQMLEIEKSPDLDQITMELAFAHDRIHQAAYALLNPEDKSCAHLKIGRLLQSSLTPAQQEDLIFEITNHLNLGMNLITVPAERQALCRLNLNAGKHAKRSNAYQTAFDHFKTALQLLHDVYQEDAWQKEYSMTLELYTQAADTAYLTGRYEEMDLLLETGIARADNLLDKVKLHLVQISACMSRGLLIDAINIARPVLAQLGHRYPMHPKKWHVIVKLLALKWTLRNTTVEDIRKIPEASDPRHRAAMAIGQRIGSAVMFSQANLLPLMIFNGVKVSVKKGHTPESLTTYGAFGMILAESLGEVDRGLAFARLGLELMEPLKAKPLEGRIHHVYHALVRHWKEPLKNSLEPLHETFKLCLENGDFEYAAHAAVLRLGYMFEAGKDLKQLQDEVLEIQAIMKPLRQGPRIHYLKSMLQKIDNLTGNSENPAVLKGQFYDIDEMTRIHKNAMDKSQVISDYMNQIFLCYYFGHHAQALTFLDSGEALAHSSSNGMYYEVSYCLLDSLVRLANIPNADKTAGKKLFRQVKSNQARLNRWANANPDNCLNKHKLVKAEQLRVSGHDFKAHELYDESILLAHKQGFIHEEALASELCGIMHATAGRTTLAHPYLARARDLYFHWGAKAKADDMEQHYPQIIEKTHRQSDATTTWGTTRTNIDVGSLIKALKAIVDQTVHSRMLETIISTALEFAGAQKGALLLRTPDNELAIEAESTVDDDAPLVLQSIPITASKLPEAVINYVRRTRSSIVIGDAQNPNDQIPGLNKDPYILDQNIRSLLCLPIHTENNEQNHLIGILYLENNRATDTFTQERFDTLEIICLAAAGRLELSRKAVIDGLTGLYNHDYFQNSLTQEFSSARRHDHNLSLVMIDIDHFKKFNDTWGHQAGDLVLKEVAQVIKSSCRISDTVARYGGEEMAVILRMAIDDTAQMVAERIRKAVENLRIVYNDELLSVTISLGMATMGPDITDKDDLIRSADIALYRSKSDGRNRLTVC